MTILNVHEELDKEGVIMPRFPFLVPDQNRYNALLFQPDANLEYSRDFGVRNADADGAATQFKKFLDLANTLPADLVACPEYSCPWKCIVELIQTNTWPSENRIWVLGCEGLPVGSLKQVRDACENHGVSLLCRDAGNAVGERTFFDPVCFLFRAKKRKSGESCLVLTIQFKNEPMGDKEDRVEPDHMARGTVIYKFRLTPGNSISLVTLLCSDVLNYVKAGQNPLRQEMELDEAALLLHLQLNPEPRHDTYAKYREFCLTDREHKDVLCLNWARNAKIRNVDKAQSETWKSTGVSAFYSKLWPLPLDQEKVLAAHRKGMYLTYWAEPRAHVAYLNFEPLVFLVALTKVSQVDVSQAQRNRALPEVIACFAWNKNTNDFQEPKATEVLKRCDGHAGMDIPHDLLAEYGIDEVLIKSFAERPIELERFIVLATNRATQYSSTAGHRWPAFEAIESMVLGAGEVIHRLTFVQDSHQDANAYRERIMKDFQDFNRARSAAANFPSHLSIFAERHEPIVLDAPSCVNLRATSGEVGLFVFDRGVGSLQKAQARHEQLKDFLLSEKSRQDERRRHSAAEFGEPDVDEERSLVWYTSAEGNIRYYPERLERKITDVGKLVPAPITRAG